MNKHHALFEFRLLGCALLAGMAAGEAMGAGMPTQETVEVRAASFDRKVNDIEYFHESRLAGEAAAVVDRHVHPAESRTLRLAVRATF